MLGKYDAGPLDLLPGFNHGGEDAVVSHVANVARRPVTDQEARQPIAVRAANAPPSLRSGC